MCLRAQAADVREYVRNVDQAMVGGGDGGGGVDVAAMDRI